MSEIQKQAVCLVEVPASARDGVDVLAGRTGVKEAGYPRFANAARALFAREEDRLSRKITTPPRYGLVIGAPARAHALLSEKRRPLPQIVSSTGVPPIDRILDGLFPAVERLIGRWPQKDYAIIAAMIADRSDQKVGDQFSKTRSQIWKRRRTLMIEGYLSLRDATLAASDLADQARGLDE